MKNINDILCVYTQGFASLEQTNKDLKTADAGFHLDPSKNELTPEEIAETRTCPVVEGWGLLDSGTGTFHSPSSAGGNNYTLSVSGNYTCSMGLVEFGSFYDSFYKKYIKVGLYSASSDGAYDYGRLYASSTLPDSKTYTFDINITVTEEAKPLPDICIAENIQRVGDDVVIPSSTEGSTKKFKITVDDSGIISATEVI